MDPKKEEAIANLDLIWPRSRWAPVLSRIVTHGASNGPVGNAAWGDRNGADTEKAIAEFIDAVSLIELACLSGWAKPQDFPSGLLILAIDLFSGHHLSRQVARRARDVLPILLQFRLKAGILGPAGLIQGEPISSSEENHLKCYDSLVDDLRNTLFDSSVRRTFACLDDSGRLGQGDAAMDALLASPAFVTDLISSSVSKADRPDDRLDPKAFLASLWAFINFTARLEETLILLSGHGLTCPGAIVRSGYWHLLSGWFDLARRNTHLLLRLTESVKGVLSENQKGVSRADSKGRSRLRLVRANEGSAVARAEAAIALIDKGADLYGASGVEYANELRGKYPWL